MTSIPSSTRPLPAAPSGPSRRDFVRGMAVGAVAISGLAPAGCGGGGDDDEEPRASFRHGVASGAPLADRVMLWTRVTLEEGASEVPVSWELAGDAAFSERVASGSATASAAGDYTVKVDATGLQPGRRYWYRFTALDTQSPTGVTRTLPTGAATQVRLAVFSCANYPAGYFNVYAEAARRADFDATVHLGDYIYEYERGGVASLNAAALGRLSEPAGETVTLADYRLRYAQYRTDADLQALHAAAPMIAVWDDHELANEAWRAGASNHQPATEGDFATRRSAAIQAYHEWLPTRSADPERIYRSFDFGNLLSLHMLDTRLAGRDRQLQYEDYFNSNGFDASALAADLDNSARQLLGAEQAAWLQQRLAASSATWQVLGQQVLMGRMNVPAPLVAEALVPGSGLTVSRYLALSAQVQASPGSLTPEQQAQLAQPTIPHNLDSWDGYPAAREAVFGMARQFDRNLVVLAGDSHNAWANDLLDLAGNRIGVEFATTSVSSPGIELVLPGEEPQALAAAFEELIGPLRYCDTSRRGYLLVTASAAECRADWIYVDTVGSRSFTAVDDMSLRTLAGAGGRQLVSV